MNKYNAPIKFLGITNLYFSKEKTKNVQFFTFKTAMFLWMFLT